MVAHDRTQGIGKRAIHEAVSEPGACALELSLERGVLGAGALDRWKPDERR
jgi:hypothetical protein